MPKDTSNAKQIKKIGKKLSHLDEELKSILDFSRSSTDRISSQFIKVLGSFKFLVGCIGFFVLWICWNLHFFRLKPFDPFPFPILEMLVSLFAIVLSVSVLINQNRQGRIDELKSQVEFEVNVRAESEITKILNLLHEVHQKLGLNSHGDEELEKMKEETDINLIHQTLEDMETKIDELAQQSE